LNSHPHVYSAPLKDRRGFNLISDTLPCGRLWYGEPDAIDNAISYTKHRSRSHHKVIRVYDAAGNVIERHEDAAFLKIPRGPLTVTGKTVMKCHPTALNLNYFELDNIPTGLYEKVIDEFDSKEL
jgi:hypothetical protein